MPEADDVPDFIIGGAMKSGTSSMRWILSSREDVFIPDRELHFFTMGDPIQFTETVKFHPERIRFDLDDEKKTEWYKSFFEAAQSDQLIGEDSTSYLPSRVAPRRIREFLPDVKLIFMLRDPVERTYSHYRHLLMTGRATKTL
ncbi:MAG: sulfotransferase, partial [Halobacteriaceae archaeon]